MSTTKNIRSAFTLQNIKTKGLTLLIEHAPCCLLSFAAASLGIGVLNHNPVLELGFAVGGALIGEYAGHKFFHNSCQHDNTLRDKVKRYGLSLVFGLTSWGIHQAIFHHDHHIVAEECQDSTHRHGDEAHPHIISKQELLRRVWGGSGVEECQDSTHSDPETHHFSLSPY